MPEPTKPEATEVASPDPRRVVLAVASLPPLQSDGTDRVLTEIADAARVRREAEQRLRYLVAYAREFVYPRPYMLADLAAAAGVSISGIRILYGPAEVAAIATTLDRPPVNRVATHHRQPTTKEPP